VHSRAHEPTYSEQHFITKKRSINNTTTEEVRLTTPKHNNEASSEFSHGKTPRRLYRWEWYDEREREQEHSNHAAVNIVGKTR
jgi:hypothetical protein